LTDPDRNLVEACQTGHGQEFEEAYRQIFALYQDRVYTVCLRVTGHADDALDAAQETMVTLARRIHDFGFRSKFSSWVYRIAVNAAIDARRKRFDAPHGSVQVQTASGDGDGPLQQHASDPEHSDPVQAIHRIEARALVKEALAHINPRFAALLTLRYIEGLSYEEIAEVQDTNLGTVKSRLNRAHAALREFLERRGWTESGDPL
jgi:RNA polymerase sigma-70 factor (ECF subfamily)